MFDRPVHAPRSQPLEIPRFSLPAFLNFECLNLESLNLKCLNFESLNLERLTVGIFSFLSLFLLLPAVARSNGPSASEIKTAAEKAIPLLEKASAGYIEQRECFSCHHQAVPVFALEIARRKGLKIDEKNFRAQVEHTHKDLNGSLESYRKGNGQGGGTNRAGYALWTLETGGAKSDETTAAVVFFLLSRDAKKGYWRSSSRRPPSEQSHFTATYVALRGLKAFAETSPEREKRFADARDWLKQNEAVETEDRVFRLLALKLALANPEIIETAAHVLRERQNKDGGWAQLPGGESDAYATATALFALREAGGNATDDPIYRQGLTYLITSQKDDGSWHVKTRSRPFQIYFETGFPHGKDQFISTSATAWSLAALAAALPDLDRNAATEHTKNINDSSLGFKSRFGIRRGPSMPLDHHPRQPAQDFALPRTRNRAADDRPTRTGLVDPRGLGIAGVELERHLLDFLSLGFGCEGGGGSSRTVPKDDGVFIADFHLLDFGRTLAEISQRPCLAVGTDGQAEDALLAVISLVEFGTGRQGFGGNFVRNRHRVEFGDHLIRDRSRMIAQPRPPVRLDRGDRLESLSFSRTVHAEPGQTIEDGSVLVLHDHDAVPPSLKAEIERGGPGADEVGIGIVNEDAVSVADDAIRHEKPAVRDRAAGVIAPNPGEYAIVVAKRAGGALGLVATIRALGIDQRIEHSRLITGLDIFAAAGRGRLGTEGQERTQKGRADHE